MVYMKPFRVYDTDWKEKAENAEMTIIGEGHHSYSNHTNHQRPAAGKIKENRLRASPSCSAVETESCWVPFRNWALRLAPLSSSE